MPSGTQKQHYLIKILSFENLEQKLTDHMKLLCKMKRVNANIDKYLKKPLRKCYKSHLTILLFVMFDSDIQNACLRNSI